MNCKSIILSIFISLALAACGGGNDDAPTAPLIVKQVSSYTSGGNNTGRTVVSAIAPGVEFDIGADKSAHFLIAGSHEQKVYFHCERLQMDVWTELANGKKFLLQRTDSPCYVGTTTMPIMVERIAAGLVALHAGHYKLDLHIEVRAFDALNSPISALGDANGQAAWTVKITQ